MNLEPRLMDLISANGHLSNVITEAFPRFWLNHAIVVYARLCHYHVIAFVFVFLRSATINKS